MKLPVKRSTDVPLDRDVLPVQFRGVTAEGPLLLLLLLLLHWDERVMC